MGAFQRAPQFAPRHPAFAFGCVSRSTSPGLRLMGSPLQLRTSASRPVPCRLARVSCPNLLRNSGITLRTLHLAFCASHQAGSTRPRFVVRTDGDRAPLLSFSSPSAHQVRGVHTEKPGFRPNSSKSPPLPGRYVPSSPFLPALTVCSASFVSARCRHRGEPLPNSSIRTLSISMAIAVPV